MIEKNLYDFFISRDFRFTRDPFSERKKWIRVSKDRIRSTINVVERILNRERSIFDANYLNWYEQKLRSVAEIKGLDIPNVNEQIFLNLGRGKFIDKLFRAYYVFTRHQELFGKLVVDNEDFFNEVSSQIGHTQRIESLTESEKIFAEILLSLSLVGPRSLGGRDTSSTLKGLKFSLKRQKVAVEAQFRRGYKDKGSLAPQHEVVVRKNFRQYFDVLEEFYYNTRVQSLIVDTVFELNSKVCIAYTRRAGFSWQDDEVTRDVKHVEKIQDLLNLWCTDNSLELEEVAKDLNRLFRRG